MDTDDLSEHGPIRISIIEHFADVPDPRIDRNKEHGLIDILVIAICALVAGCEACTQIAEFGRRKEAWLRKFLELPNGIPSHDTFSRVLALIDPDKFQECFMRWAAAVQQATRGKIVALDGKTLRRSFDHTSGLAPVHLVSAWCSENHVSLGQVAVDTKSNEITAIPALLELLEIEGAIVTIDAAGCQRAIATTIRKQKADYVLALKKNQSTLYEDVERCFAELKAEEKSDDSDGTVFQTEDKRHGREEHRITYAVAVRETIRQRELWRDLKSIAIMESRRTVGGREETHVRYFISSLDPHAERMARAIRGHWGVENSLHWVLDVTFREDDSRIRKGHGAENIAALRRLAVTLLKREPTKQSIATKRLMAAWDEDYLWRVLLAGDPN